MNKNNKKGFTLIELLIATGFISLGSVGAYAVANTANDYRKSSTEVKALNALIQQVENSTSTTENYQGISLSSLAFNSSLTLADVQPEAKKLNFIYQDVGSRVCNDFTSKMLASSKNIEAIVNGSNFNKENIKDIAVACYQDTNDLRIVLNKELKDYSINTVVASINLPPPPVPEIAIPAVPVPASWTPPTAFTASTAVPTTYPITTVTPPSFGPIVGGGGPINVTSPGSPITPTVPQVPNWNPPAVYIPPATPAGPDVIDQDPNAPPKPPVTPTQPPAPVGNILNRCLYNGLSFYFKGFQYQDNNGDEFNPIQYYEKFGNLGTFYNATGSIKTLYDNVLNQLPSKNPAVKNYSCKMNII